MTTKAPGTRSPAISDVEMNSGPAAAVGGSPRLNAINPCSRLELRKKHMRGQGGSRQAASPVRAKKSAPALHGDPSRSVAVPPTFYPALGAPLNLVPAPHQAL